MLHLFHVVFYLLWYLFTVRCFPVTLTIICVFIMLHYFNLFTLFFRLHAYMVCFFPATLFTSCSFLILSSLHVAYFFHVMVFSCCTLFIFNFSFPVDPFSCCTTFILHIFMLHIFFMLHFQQFPLFIPHFLTLSLISWCAFCHAAFSSCCLPVATFSCDTF